MKTETYRVTPLTPNVPTPQTTSHTTIPPRPPPLTASSPTDVPSGWTWRVTGVGRPCRVGRRRASKSRRCGWPVPRPRSAPGNISDGQGDRISAGARISIRAAQHGSALERTGSAEDSGCFPGRSVRAGGQSPVGYL